MIINFYFNEMVYNITHSIKLQINIYAAIICEPPSSPDLESWWYNSLVRPNDRRYLNDQTRRNAAAYKNKLTPPATPGVFIK